MSRKFCTFTACTQLRTEFCCFRCAFCGIAAYLTTHVVVNAAYCYSGYGGTTGWLCLAFRVRDVDRVELSRLTLRFFDDVSTAS